MKYSECTVKELEKFPGDRRLKVESTSHRGDRPLRRDYLTALQKADEEWTFSFMDLPPEHRNSIYEELLTLPNAWTCYPQILATCKQINHEATTLLYLNNLNTVVLTESDVQVHGERYGAFSPFGARTLPHDHPLFGQERRSMSTSEWPDFLHRVRWLKCTICIADGSVTLGLFRPRLLNCLLYSLCSCLKGHHKLRGIELDARALFSRPTERQMEQTLRPLQLLGPLKKITARPEWCELGYHNQAFPAQDYLQGIPLQHCRSHLNEADELRELFRYDYITRQAGLANGVFFEKSGTIQKFRRQPVHVLHRLLDCSSFCDAAWEDEVAKALADWQDTLECINVGVIVARGLEAFGHHTSLTRLQRAHAERKRMDRIVQQDRQPTSHP